VTAVIALAPNYGLWAIILGGGFAHICCILCALVLGKVIQKVCTEHLINVLGGCLFIIFGLYELFFKVLYPNVLPWSEE
jgi:putative Ca2+/H+ antiporter (TMEM165/GDT1 family)